VADAALEGIARLAGLAGSAWTEAIDALIDLTADTNRRAAALEALARVPPDRVDRVARGLTHPLATVRRSTIEALTRLKHPDASARVRDALDHEDPVVREAAVIAVDRIGARGVARKLSAIAAADPDIAVRRAASVALARDVDRQGEGGPGG
jgi:HEAT repeat protein